MRFGLKTDSLIIKGCIEGVIFKKFFLGFGNSHSRT